MPLSPLINVLQCTTVKLFLEVFRLEKHYVNRELVANKPPSQADILTINPGQL